MVPPNDASAPQMKKFPRGGQILGWCCYLVLGWCCHFGLADPGTKKACGATSDPIEKVCTSAQPHKNVSKEGWWGKNGEMEIMHLLMPSSLSVGRALSDQRAAVIHFQGSNTPDHIQVTQAALGVEP